MPKEPTGLFCFVSLLPCWVLSSICIHCDAESTEELIKVLSCLASTSCSASWVSNHLFWINKYFVEERGTKFGSCWLSFSYSWDPVLSMLASLNLWYLEEMSFIYFQLSPFFLAECLGYLTIIRSRCLPQNDFWK